jgi:vanillate O-demethylase monooxygenase subunit
VRSQDKVPPGAGVRAFPLVERPPFVWLWPGEPGLAGLRTPPDTPCLSAPGWTAVAERARVEANYLLLHEHYLDLTTVGAMHPENLPPGLDRLPTLDEVEVSAMSVRYVRHLPPAPLAGWEAEATGLPRELDYRRTEHGSFVAPGLHVQRWIIEGERTGPHEQVRVHGFTPETPTSTHVFLQVARDYAAGREVIDRHFHRVFTEMLGKDAALLEVVQRRLAEPDEPRRDVNVKADRAALRARRVVREMIAEETTPASARGADDARGLATPRRR